jgi:hypothetical protein
MTIWRSWIGATSSPGSVVSRVNAAPVPSVIGRHRPAKQNHSSPTIVNFHFRLRRLGTGEFEKGRGRYQAAADWEAATLGAKVDDRRAFRVGRGKSPAKHGELVGAILQTTDDRRGIGGPDVVARSKIGRGIRKTHRHADFAECLPIRFIQNGVAEIVAQVGVSNGRRRRQSKRTNRLYDLAHPGGPHEIHEKSSGQHG